MDLEVRSGMARVGRIDDVRADVGGGLGRVCADVDGRPLWFESADVPLRPAPEAFGSAMLPAAVERKADPVLGTPVDPRWHTGVMALQDVWNAWWKYRKVSVRSSAGQDGDGTRASGGALCFSGGVDSFFSLLRGGFVFDYLVFVHGYDMPLAGVRRGGGGGAWRG